MKKVILMFAAGTMLFAHNMAAQDAAVTAAATTTEKFTPEKHAELRAAAYAEAFGLGEKETAKMTRIFLEGEKQLADVRAGEMSKDAEARIAEVMHPYDEQAEQMLSKEQMTKLEQMKKEGTWHPGAASCAPAAGKSCHGAAAKAGGCCAGKAGSHGAKAATPAQNVQ